MSLGAVYAAIVMSMFQGPLARWVAPGVNPERARVCAIEVGYAVAAHRQYLDVLLVTAATVAGESACDPRARSADGEDCGIVQQRGVARHGRSCAELMRDPDLALDLWLSDLEDATDACGSLSLGLGVLYGGKCGGRPSLVRFRCTRVGLDPWCRLPDLASVF